MLAELRDENQTLGARFREVHGVCDEHRGVATASLIEVWIDETERRTCSCLRQLASGLGREAVLSTSIRLSAHDRRGHIAACRVELRVEAL